MKWSREKKLELICANVFFFVPSSHFCHGANTILFGVLRFARVLQHVRQEEETAGDLSSVELRAPCPHGLRPAGAEVHRTAAAMAEPAGGHCQPAQTHGGPLLHHPHPAGAHEGREGVKSTNQWSFLNHGLVSSSPGWCACFHPCSWGKQWVKWFHLCRKTQENVWVPPIRPFSKFAIFLFGASPPAEGRRRGFFAFWQTSHISFRPKRKKEAFKQ